MALQVGELYASLDMDTTDFDRGTAKAESGFGKLKGAIIGLGVGAIVAKVGKDMVMAASDAAEMQSKFDTVFGATKGAAESWAESMANDLGRSKTMIKTNLAANQGLLTGMGMSREAAAKMSEQMISAGMDLASFNNLEDQDAIDRVSKAMMGQHDVADALGAKLNDATLAETMHTLGIKGKFSALKESDKMMVRYNTIMLQNKDAVGDAHKTQASFANQLKRLQSVWQDLLPILGGLVLPVLNLLLIGFNKLLAPLVKTLPSALNNLQKTFGGVFGGMKPYADEFQGVFEAIQAAFMNLWYAVEPILKLLWGAIVWAFNDAKTYILSLMPVFNELIVGFVEFINSIAILLRGLVGWYKDHSRQVNAIFIYMWSRIKAVFAFGLQVLRGVLKIFSGLFSGDWNKVWDGVKIIIKGAWEFLKTMFSASLKFLNDITGGAMAKLGRALWKPIEDAKNKIGGFVGSIKNFFKGLGGGTVAGGTMKTPTVSWKANGGFFSSPSIVGVGERGMEAIVPLGNNNAAQSFAAAFLNKLRDVAPTGMRLAGSGGIVVNVIGGTKDPRALAKEISIEIARQTQIKSRVKGV